jgi:hypothetical protein
LSEIDFELPFIACPEPTGSEALRRQTRQSQHPDKYLVKISLDLLEAENLKSKDLANEQPHPANGTLRLLRILNYSMAAPDRFQPD